MSQPPLITFHFQYLKRDFTRIAQAIVGEEPYWDERGNASWSPEHHDGGEDARSSVAIMGWGEHWSDEAEISSCLHHLGEMKIAPAIEPPKGFQGDHDDHVIINPWARENELDFVPFTGWYSVADRACCFASYRHETVICAANPQDPEIPLDSETHSQPGQKYIELYQANERIFAWFHENCRIAGLLTYDYANDHGFEVPAPPRARSNFGAIHTQHWKKIPQPHLAYDPDRSAKLKPEQISDSDLFESEYQKWRNDRHKRRSAEATQRPAAQTKRRRKRKRR
jgi:hypothetical protein